MSTQPTLQPLYVTMVTGTTDNVTRIVVSDSTGKELGILGGVHSAQLHCGVESATSVMNLSIVRAVGALESEVDRHG